ncbi:uncharacterized protein EI97DRAFT_433157, partial [Westerdykella ornata]
MMTGRGREGHDDSLWPERFCTTTKAREGKTASMERSIPEDEGDTALQDFQNPDDDAALSPVVPRGPSQERPYPRPGSSRWLRSSRRGSQKGTTGGNPLPETFQNLDEVAVPGPIPHPQRQSSLFETEREGSFSQRPRSKQPVEEQPSHRESHKESTDEFALPQSFENLTEVAAGPRVPDRHRQRSIFEDERVGSRATSLGITALPVLPRQPPEEIQPKDAYYAAKETESRRRRSRIATELYTISYLILFSILGALARLGLDWLTFYPGAPVVFPVLWANFAGTLVMGFLSEDQRFFRYAWGRKAETAYGEGSDEEKEAPTPAEAAKALHNKVKKTIPLYIGLTTGFCGSFTSFSSFMRDAFLALSNDLLTPLNHPSGAPQPSVATTVPRNGGYSFMAVCAIVILTVGLCHSALTAGAHLAIFADPVTPTLPFHILRRFVDPVFVFLAWGLWLGAIVMAIWTPDRPGGPASSDSWAKETWRGQALMACVFAPLGCLIRFYVSLKLNGVIPSFPMGTFACNIFGTAILGMAWDLQHVRIGGAGVAGGRVGCQVLEGVMDGFCGTLSTVSTWVLELGALKRGHAWVYGGVSVGTGLGLLVVVMGGVRWSVGWEEIACV